jgi:hypothetical protein
MTPTVGTRFNSTLRLPPYEWCAAVRPNAAGLNRIQIMNSIIYIVGLIVIVVAILSFSGLR